MQLVIVESPTKAKTIGKFLGSGYIVKSSFGHVRDLPKTKTGVDVEHDFAPHYLVPPKAKKIVAELKEDAKKADHVILATDEDREGEAIAWHLVQALGLDTKKGELKIERIVFHEITKSAIEKALEHPRDIDENLVDAQQARRVLDRLVGYELSPFLWKKIRYGLSAGRVQSVAVRLVVEREREIQAFKVEEYWSIEAEFLKHDQPIAIKARLIKIHDKTLDKMDIGDKEKAEKIVADAKTATYKIESIEQKETQRNPAPPFTTSTLQQEAARKLGMSAKQTMTIAQKLYEGIDIGERGHTGLITYMRTDSVNLSESAITQSQQEILKDFGKEYLVDGGRRFKTKSKGAQEAHEAIRPADLSIRPESIKKYLDAGQLKLYDLIWKRTIASQMQPARFEQTAIDIIGINHENKSFTFRANGQIMQFNGFIRAYTEGKDEDAAEDLIEGQLPPVKEGEPLKTQSILPLQHFTEPPARFSDATLVKALEQHGIGRPSTYAPILTTIQDRGYVDKEDKKYHPTETGFQVNDMLVENFPEIVDINFTSQIEEELDEIAEGKRKWVPVIREFYTPFEKNLKAKEKSVEKLIEMSETPCPHCGKMMIIKFGRMGKFLACPDPESKVTMPLPEEAAVIAELTEKTKDERCPKCGKPMEVKRGRFGYFLGCSDYPNCKGISKIVTRIGFKCPECTTGDMLEKKSRGRGKVFYACSRFPDCTFAINQKPTTQEELSAMHAEWKANPPKPKKSYGKKFKTEKETE